MTDTRLTDEELRRLLAQHVEVKSWPSTRTSRDRRLQPDGYLHYCAIDHQEPWPCLTLRLLAEVQQLRQVREAAAAAATDYHYPTRRIDGNNEPTDEECGECGLDWPCPGDRLRAALHPESQEEPR